MKTSGPLKNIRRALALLLCCLLITGCLGLSAAADVGEAPAETAEEGGLDNYAEDTGAVDTDGAALDAGSSTDDADEPPECGNVSVIFDFGDFGTVTQIAVPGMKPESVPDIPEDYSWQGQRPDEHRRA